MMLQLRWSYGVKLLAQADDPSDSPIRLPDDGDEAGERRIRDLESSLPSTSTSASTMIDGDCHTKPPSIVVDDTFTRDSSPSPSPPPVHPYDRNPTSHLKRHLSHFYRSFPNSPNQSRVVLVQPSEVEGEQESSESEDRDNNPDSVVFPEQPPRLRRRSQSHVCEPPSAIQTYFLHSLMIFWHAFTDFMTVVSKIPISLDYLLSFS